MASNNPIILRYNINLAITEDKKVIYIREFNKSDNKPPFKNLIYSHITDLKDLFDWSKLNADQMPDDVGLYQAVVEYRSDHGLSYTLSVLDCTPLYQIDSTTNASTTDHTDTVDGPYRKMPCLEPIICERNEYTNADWILLERLFTPDRHVSRILLNINTIESFSEGNV